MGFVQVENTSDSINDLIVFRLITPLDATEEKRLATQPSTQTVS